MTYGFPWSEQFVHDLAEDDFRNEFVADQIRMRIAMLIRALREAPDRKWSQADLGRLMGKPQSVISRLEDPEYGKLSVQTLLEVAAAFKLPLWIDIPEWEDWLTLIKNVPNAGTRRRSFDAKHLASLAGMGVSDRDRAATNTSTVLHFPRRGDYANAEQVRTIESAAAIA
ncbi:MAG: helix-turn-helix domain-containing protein [Roseiarcus sp.]